MVPVEAVLKKHLVLFVAVAVGEGVEKRDMISALAVWGLDDVDGVGARKSRSKMLEPAVGAAVGAGGAAAAVAWGMAAVGAAVEGGAVVTAGARAGGSSPPMRSMMDVEVAAGAGLAAVVRERSG
jgi:hypothetical protein